MYPNLYLFTAMVVQGQIRNCKDWHGEILAHIEMFAPNTADQADLDESLSHISVRTLARFVESDPGTPYVDFCRGNESHLAGFDEEFYIRLGEYCDSDE